MNDLEKYFENNDKRVLHKWLHYFEVYERHFSKYRDKEIVLVEIGSFHGGSLQMWKDYFGPKIKIIGIDINPECLKLKEDQIDIIIGDQNDKDFLESLKSKIPKIDILIDDGGHTMSQQINTFESLFDHVDPNGIYLCEDTHTSYWKDFGGGFKKSSSFIEYSKHFIDYIHAWHTEKLTVSDFTKSAKSLHYYDSIVVIEKCPMVEPTHRKTGSIALNMDGLPNMNITFKSKIKSLIKKLLYSKN
ncbi:MAG: class I SAM-dependent methyltransferase [Bacteriovoracaceae bacterium]|jgi:23S rRNA U2552 (ribose-2'-O)-methylase RlmE/FtsJ|nr:class I SAM-dependent methyltransferase [Bacteriovoracaceae bacterium]